MHQRIKMIFLDVTLCQIDNKVSLQRIRTSRISSSRCCARILVIVWKYFEASTSIKIYTKISFKESKHNISLFSKIEFSNFVSMQGLPFARDIDAFQKHPWWHKIGLETKSYAEQIYRIIFFLFIVEPIFRFSLVTWVLGKGDQSRVQNFDWGALKRGALAEISGQIIDLPKPHESSAVPQWPPPPQNWKSKKPATDKHQEPYNSNTHGDDSWAEYFDQR